MEERRLGCHALRYAEYYNQRKCSDEMLASIVAGAAYELLSRRRNPYDGLRTFLLALGKRLVSMFILRK